MLQDSQPVHLLWTGGWDSTFRLLYLLIKLNKTVQPHYIIDADRRSTSEELFVRNKIVDLMVSRFPETKGRLCPSIFYDKTEIPDMPDVTASYARLRQCVPIGSQYEWMAKYCKMQGLQQVETCIHTGGTANKLLDPMVVKTEEVDDHYYSVDSQYKNTDEYNVFGYYRFPVYDVHKVDMEKVARDYGWMDMMKITYFCQRPMADHSPCGRCHPCGMVMKEGMTWRMPLKSQIMYYVTLRPFVHSKLYQGARQVKRMILPSRECS
jgi:hypothetical protein